MTLELAKERVNIATTSLSPASQAFSHFMCMWASNIELKRSESCVMRKEEISRNRKRDTEQLWSSWSHEASVWHVAGRRKIMRYNDLKMCEKNTFACFFSSLALSRPSINSLSLLQLRSRCRRDRNVLAFVNFLQILGYYRLCLLKTMNPIILCQVLLYLFFCVLFLAIFK